VVICSAETSIREFQNRWGDWGLPVIRWLLLSG
jgi:hypothetical protein